VGDGVISEKQRAAERWNPCLPGKSADRAQKLQNIDKEKAMAITPGELRGRTQPTILLRMLKPVEPAPGNVDRKLPVFSDGEVVFAQYIGNGRLLLTPVDTTSGYGPQVVMASALNSTAEIISRDQLFNGFNAKQPSQDGKGES
jgi:hypothetical protein